MLVFRKFRTAACISLLWLAGGTVSRAAEIKVTRVTEGLAQINVVGDLRYGDEAAFLAATLGIERALVTFASHGGNLRAGLEIGRMIRARRFNTMVAEHDHCASACALAWLGGVRRFMGATSRIGFHAAYEIERGEVLTSGVGNALIGAYLANIGLSNEAVVYITVARPSEMNWLNLEQARQRGIEVSIFGPAVPIRPEDDQRQRDDVRPDALPSMPNANRAPLVTPTSRDALPSAALPSVGSIFRDCSDCPEMVVLPAGRFMMGSPTGEAGREPREGPQREVSVAQPFAVSRFLITAEEYRLFVVATRRPDRAYCFDLRNHYGDGVLDWFEDDTTSKIEIESGFERHPVTCVSWSDAVSYATWLSRTTGKTYRLLTEAEWEYAARGGRVSPFWWGSIQREQCLYSNGADLSAGFASDWNVANCRDGFRYTNPVGHYPANGFRLHDMAGNVRQWVLDCFRESLAQAPIVASRAVQFPQCGRRVLRGGSWADEPNGLRLAIRDQDRPDVRSKNIGFRIARISDADRR